MGLPGWYLFLQVLFPAAIGIGGGALAFNQWRTSNQKVVLDLFERRFRLYHSVRELNRRVVGSGRATAEQADEMRGLWTESRFLFGSDVAGRIESLIDAMWDLETTKSELVADLPKGPEQSALVAAKRDALAKVETVQKQLPDLCLPYMRMDTKVIRSPRQWYRDIRKRRSSAL